MFTAEPRRLATAWTTGMSVLPPDMYTVFAPVGHAAAAAWPEIARTALPTRHALPGAKHRFFIFMADHSLRRLIQRLGKMNVYETRREVSTRCNDFVCRVALSTQRMQMDVAEMAIRAAANL